jgi:hypothetical protein
VRRRTCLNRLNRSFTRRIRQLESIAAQVAGKSGQDIDRAVAFVTIESLSAWAGFTREFYLSCVLLQPKTISGAHVFHNVSSIVDERSALIHSITVLKGLPSRAIRIAPRDEPVWHEKRTLPNLSKSLSFSNDQSVVAGFSYQMMFFDELPTARNFYAHRSQGTAEKVLYLAKTEV